MNDSDLSSLETKTAHPMLKRILFVSLGVFIVLGLAGGYYWQYTKIEDAQSEIRILGDKNMALNDQLDALKSKALNEDNITKQPIVVNPTDLTGATQVDLTVTPTAAQYVNPAGTVTEAGSWFGIRVTLSNTAANDVNLVVKNFSLKDANGNAYAIAGFSGATTLPEGWGANTLQDQSIPAGGSISGTLIFQMANKNQTTFTLLNITKPYTVTANQ